MFIVPFAGVFKLFLGLTRRDTAMPGRDAAMPGWCPICRAVVNPFLPVPIVPIVPIVPFIPLVMPIVIGE